MERLERYCAAMNEREPRPHIIWFVAKDDKGRGYVENRTRGAGEWS